jgi:hypothetical protein
VTGGVGRRLLGGQINLFGGGGIGGDLDKISGGDVGLVKGHFDDGFVGLGLNRSRLGSRGVEINFRERFCARLGVTLVACQMDWTRSQDGALACILSRDL